MNKNENMKKNIVRISTILLTLFFSLAIASDIGNCKILPKPTLKQPINKKSTLKPISKTDVIKIVALVKDFINYDKYKLNRFEIGSKKGLNIATIIGLNNIPIFDFNSGFYIKYNINKNLFIKQEFIYSYEGSNLKQEINESPKNKALRIRIKTNEGSKVKEVRLNRLCNEYINLPLLIGYSFNDISLEIGPEFNFAIKRNKNITDLKKEIKEEIIDINNIGISFIVGTEFAVGKYINLPILSLTGRYKIGFTKVFEAKKFNSNSVFQIGLSIKFF
ncbi:MAG: PorT family protein [Candidatus Bostrichicola ureolyticus]|nr:MAG: PorT family protein [Candidatus Bostrichicola ureolyticus]